MSRSRRIPKHCHHKASNCGVVRLSGVDHYTAKWGTPEAESEYERLVAEWLANGRSGKPGREANRSPARSGAPLAGHTVEDLILAFWKFAEVHYRRPDGTHTSELNNYRQALRPLRAMYGREPAAAFSPSKLKLIRARWIADGICRRQINLRGGRLKRVFKWGVSEELVPVAVWQALLTVQGLQAHRTEARESPEVKPVPDYDVEATLPHLRPQVRDMIRVQRLTGMRPGEVCQLRWGDVDRAGDVWEFRPVQHKTAWRGKDRVVFIGPRAQGVLSQYARDDPTAYIFSPREAVEQLHKERGERRTTKYYASRQGWQQRKADPLRRPRDRYSVTAYGQAVRRACTKAGVLVWKPNQLRHAAGTAVHHRHGIEAAQVVLGHSRADVTQVYAERDYDLARRIAAEMG